jgi:mRNA-degrading endonuclease toxin of MazEF toxin-antitoxin module
MSALRRGDVVRSETLPGAQLWVVISNDERNEALNTVVVARIASVVKAQTPTIVPLGAHDPFTGHVLADFLATERAASLSPSGRLTTATVEAVSSALRVALP